MFVNMEPNGSENFKTLLLLQVAAKRFQTSEFASKYSPHKTTLGRVEILSIRFFSEIFQFTIVPYGETPKLNDRKRAVVEQKSEILGLWILVDHIWGTFDSIQGRFFRKYDFQSASSTLRIVFNQTI